MDDAVDQLLLETMAAGAPRGAEPHWAQCSVPGCLTLVSGAPSGASGGRVPRLHARFRSAIVLRAAETPRSGNRLAHVAWVTRVCIDHLRRGDVRLCDDEPKRLCWKCHKLQPVTAFEVCCAPRCAAQRPLTWLYSTRQGARRTCIEMMLKHNLRRRMKRTLAATSLQRIPPTASAGETHT